MKELIVSMLLFFSIIICNVSYKKEMNVQDNQLATKNMNVNNTPISGNKLKIKVGEKIFTATILDNATANAFKALLPLTLQMVELNNNEKYTQLPKSLPTNAAIPTSIQSGDLMMYGSRTLVLFYKDFSTSYSYTKIGKIDDITELTASVGSSDVKVLFVL